MTGTGALKLAAAVFAADQFCKISVEKQIPVGTRLPLRGNAAGERRPDVVLQHVKNRGFALGKLGKHPWLVRGVSGAVSAVMTAAFAKSLAEDADPLYRTGFAMVTGGGLSNTADRLFKGEVTDYISFTGTKAGKREIVYNTADLAIFAGSAMMLVSALRPWRKGKKHGPEI